MIKFILQSLVANENLVLIRFNFLTHAMSLIYLTDSEVHLFASYCTVRNERLFVVVACDGSDYFECNGRCVPGRQICDGISHCPNGEDERNCCMFNCLVYATVV